MWCRVASLAVGFALVAGCSGDTDTDNEPEPQTRTTQTTTPTRGPTSTPSDHRPEHFDPEAVLADVRHLANEIGPREATSPGFRRAARFVTRRLQALGYRVRRTEVRVPAGDSWGVPVDAGTSYNLIAQLPDFEPTDPYRIVGAHLDTVAVSPGAEDNASGTSVLLELARMAAEQPPRVPVRFIAFGAEEPRGESDDMHHFGSTEYVRSMTRAERASLAGMVSLDRVGVRASAVPICVGGPDGEGLRAEVTRAARRAGIPYEPCEDRASDHWSFEKAGLPAIRLGSIPYAGYHSARDRPHFVDERQVGRVGRIMWRWLTRPAGHRRGSPAPARP